MSDTPNPSPAPRPRPVLYAQLVLAGLSAITGAAGFGDHIPAGVAWWLFTALAAANVVLGLYLQTKVTPLSDPRAADGTPLTPAGS